ncbi:MAG: hypothetical protein Q8Q85_00550 [Gemmatimonadales bacterium]|nr:hypothetical protein [Gemmatimonadales bacterium]
MVAGLVVACVVGVGLVAFYVAHRLGAAPARAPKLPTDQERFAALCEEAAVLKWEPLDADWLHVRGAPLVARLVEGEWEVRVTGTGRQDALRAVVERKDKLWAVLAAAEAAQRAAEVRQIDQVEAQVRAKIEADTQAALRALAK